MSDSEINELEINIEQARSIIHTKDALERLHHNQDFKKIILEDFLEGEAIRLVHLKGSPNMQSPEMQAAIVKDMDAIGSLRSYFSKVYNQGMQAEKAIEDNEQTLAELRGEDIN